jgi:ABC-2 type transport system ATP-binding protein
LSAIEVTSLKKHYGQLKAVDDISFSVQQGDIFSLLGPNGAGKTTTVEILEGLRERDAGDVRVLGMDPWEDGYALHRRIGVIPQGFRFFDKSTPIEAVRYYAELFDSKVDPETLIKEVTLEDSKNMIFENLSGGQKQKVGLALALVNSPELLFLDEPTTGLDPQARRTMWAVIRSLKREGRSILLTTHYLEEAQLLADKVAIMNKGKIIAAGSPEELINKYGSGKRQVMVSDTLEDVFVKLVGAPIEDEGEIVKAS